MHLSQKLIYQSYSNLHTSVWTVVENICNLLQPFAQYITLVSGEKYTTMSAIVPVITEFQLHLEESIKVSDLSLVATVLKRKLTFRFRKYTHNDQHDPLFLLLDPASQ